MQSEISALEAAIESTPLSSVAAVESAGSSVSSQSSSSGSDSNWGSDSDVEIKTKLRAKGKQGMKKSMKWVDVKLYDTIKPILN